jgi:hypothetical protein
MNSSVSKKGFVLPVALGVGLIAILLGIMIVARSSQNRITATAQKETARSLAAAETGITKFQSLFDRYRPLSTLCSSTVSCPTATTTWQNVTDLVLAPDGSCEAAANIVQDYADDVTNNQWQDLGDGQFRLFSYAYSAAPSGSQLGTGTLIVEGRVNGNSGGIASSRTSTTRLKVEFKVNDGRATAGTLPGLWINDDLASSADSTVVLNTNIRNSTCTPDATQVGQLTDRIPSPSADRYASTAGASFPDLPKQGMSLAALGTHTSIPAIDNTTSPLANTTGASVIAYQIAQSSDLSINRSSGLPLMVGTADAPATFILYLDGGMSISAGSQIKVMAGSTLIIYAHGAVSLVGASAPPILQIAPDGTPNPSSDPKNVQIYVYAAGTPAPTVNISSGSGSPMDLFLFAPKSQVTMASGKVKGMIWAKSWVGSNSAEIIQSSVSATDLEKVTFPPRISPITVWQRQRLGS